MYVVDVQRKPIISWLKLVKLRNVVLNVMKLVVLRKLRLVVLRKLRLVVERSVNLNVELKKDVVLRKV